MVLKIWSTINRTFCHSGPFFVLLSPYGPRKSKFFKNEKNTWRYYHFTNVYHKRQSYDVWFLKYRVQRTEVFVILDRVLSFYFPNNPKNQNFEKMKKNNWRYYHFTYVYQNWQSYDVWFLRHWARQTEFFVILDHFLPFYPLNNLKNQNFEKTKKTPGDISILHKCTINDNHIIRHFPKHFSTTGKR